MPDKPRNESNTEEAGTEQGAQSAAPAISLPKGGGAIRGIGEKFAANPVTGTGSMTVSIATSPGRSGFGPQLALSYDSGAGNGPFGLGWNLSLPSITRKTDKGLPRYQDADESDVFILSGAEDLVPCLKEIAPGEWQPEVVPPRTVGAKTYDIHRYRPRIEGLFARIERWTNQADPSDTFWRSISKDNITTWYGKTDESRISDPASARIFSWLICESYDDKGNAIIYKYVSENADDVDHSHVNERNRVRTANRYLKRIKYGNTTPYFPVLAEDQALTPLPTEWLFEVVFDYFTEKKDKEVYSQHYKQLAPDGDGQLFIEPPSTKDLKPWDVRQDPFSSYRAGFEVRTYRLCQRVLMFHHFPDELDGIDDYLVRSTEFNYQQSPIASFITSVTQSGYKYYKDKGKFLKKTLPPLAFEYSKATIQQQLHTIDPDSLENLPQGLDGALYQWADLDGEGAGGILTEQDGAWFYKRNLSPLPIEDENGQLRQTVRFAPMERISPLPSFSGLSSGEQQLLDLAGDGQVDVVTYADPIPGFFERTDDGNWQSFKPFKSLPNINWQDPNLKFVDLSGDGHADIFITEDEAFTWYPSLAEAGFEPARQVQQMLDEEQGPRLVFADGTDSIYLSDISGDGLTDLVRIRNGEVCYWPNLGYCRFGAKVTMDNAPWFDNPDQFDQKRIRLADIDGSGVTDILYLNHDRVDIYLNQSGNRWADASVLKHLPAIDNTSSVMAVDLMGNGTACLVWSSPLPGNAGSSMRYVDLMGGPSMFAVADIKDLTSFVDKLSNPADPISQFLQEQFSTETKNLLTTFDGSDSGSKLVRNALVKELAIIVKWKIVFDEQRFTGVTISSKTKKLLLHDSQEQGRTLLNLLLLEDAYPRELVSRERTGQKPHLLISVKNNLGAETRVHYAPSTKFYLKDKEDGKAWITRLHFPVHVVEKVETYDHISRNRFVTRYAYHHGFFDGHEREFRSFGMVEQWDTEEFAALSEGGEFPDATNMDEASRVPPVLTRTWFHTGVYLGRNHVSDYFAGMLNVNDIGEYYREPAWRNDDTEAGKRILDDTVLPDDISLEGEREACRALKGSMLRQEVYALDGTGTEDYPYGHPYTVTEQNFTLRLVQPKGDNRHAVFFAHPHEALSYHYERNSADPRVSHSMTLAVDKYGNVLRSIAIGYPRANVPERRPEQNETHLTLTLGRFINRDDQPDWRRIGLPVETRTYEIVKPPAASSRFTWDDLYDLTEVLVPTGQTEPALAKTVPYQQWDWRQSWDPQAESGGPVNTRLRLIEHVRVLYRKNDLTGPLDIGQVESMALSFETYKLAFTPELATQTFVDSGKTAHTELNTILSNGGGYVHSEGDPNWWIPSGRIFYREQGLPADELAEAEAHFYLPRRFEDPFGNKTYVRYASDLLVLETEDALGNKVSTGARDANTDVITPGIDYRVLQPERMMGPNRNVSTVAFDALGMVVGTEIMGKPEDNYKPGDSLDDYEPDLIDQWIIDHIAHPLGRQNPPLAPHDILDKATTRLVYDLFAYQRTRHDQQPQPSVVYTLARETHHSDLTGGEETKIQHSFSYSDGFGREIQKKIQAEPEKIAGVVGPPRWVGSGWTIFNNKGKPVRQYEPFFSPTHRFEFGVKVGVSPILFYDPVGRVIATLHPNHTYEKVVFDPWQQTTYDVNDTVSPRNAQTGDPRTDLDISGYVEEYFKALPVDPTDPWQTWYQQRISGAKGPHEIVAAQKTEAHADTPTTAHFDALGRPFLTVARNRVVSANHPLDGTEDEFATRVELDIEGNQRAVRDAIEQAGDPQGRIVMRYAYDMLGNRIHQLSMEAGARWMLNDVAGKLIRAWDSRGHKFVTAYDALRRPIEQYVRGTTADSDPRTLNRDILVDKIEYGEGQANAETLNLRTRIYRHSDSAGVVTNAQLDTNGNPSEAYDFKGNLLRSTRQLVSDYTAIPDWLLNPKLKDEVFTSSTRYDALNRPVQSIAPHSDLARGNPPKLRFNIIQPVFNEANLLERVDVWLARASEPADRLNPTVDTPSPVGVSNIDYDAKGQRQRIDYKNGASTLYDYDPLTFRLVHLLTRRNAHDCPQPAPVGWPGCQVQNLHYTYDPAGNITHIQDDAQQRIYFSNQRVEPSNDYTYDALYRLIEATGREHLGQGGAPIPHSHNDAGRVGVLSADAPGRFNPKDGNAMGRYVERYEYDAVGNFLEMQHRGGNPTQGWRRAYACGETSLIEDGTGGALLKTSNRLTSTTLNPNGNNPQMDSYLHDAHGNMVRMPHLGGALPGPNMHWDYKDQLRQTDLGGGGTAYYVYDASGQRVRKVWEKAPGLTEERIYLGGFEIFRRHGGAIGTNTATLERETLHIMDGKQRIALVETRTLYAAGNDLTPAQLIRYQFGNHLGSTSLELDLEAQIISYEEYTPFGNTSYQAVRNQTETAKRYRYSAREKDEESGLCYYGARYYAPAGLARWLSTDPVGIIDDTNLYSLTKNNPISNLDDGGTTTKDVIDDRPSAEELIFRSSIGKTETISVGEAMARVMERHYLPESLPYPAPGESGAGPEPPHRGMKASNFRSCSPTIYNAWRDAVGGISLHSQSIADKSTVIKGRTGRLKVNEFYDISQSKLTDKNPRDKHIKTRGLIDALILIGEGQEISDINDIERGDIFATKTKEGGHVRLVLNVIRYDSDVMDENGKQRKEGSVKAIEYIHAGFGEKKEDAKKISGTVTTKKGDKKFSYYEGQKGEQGNPAVQIDTITIQKLEKKIEKGERVYFGRASGEVLWNTDLDTSEGLTTGAIEFKKKKTIFHLR